jgi:hypothetical protein
VIRPLTLGVLLVAGCGRLGFDEIDDGQAALSCIERWQAGAIMVEPVRVANLNSGYTTSPFVTADGSELYYRSGTGSLDFYRAFRSGTDWAGPMQIAELATASSEFAAVVTADKRLIVFTSDRPGAGAAGANIWQATRASDTGPFSSITAAPFVNVNTDGEEYEAFLSADRLRLYGSHYVSDQDLWLATRASTQDAFGPPQVIDELSGTFSQDCCPTLTEDELVIVFGSRRAGPSSDLFYATRASSADPFSSPRPLPGANDAAIEEKDPFVTADGCTLYFATESPPTADLYRSPI